jgi:hypothetical protein
MIRAGGICFRELMVGGFVFGETDPHIGEDRGLRSQSFLAMHALAAIPNVSEFVENPQHAGELSGALEFSSWAKKVEADQGAFSLFVRSTDTAKSMIYSMGFRAQGKEFYLQGTKHVARRSLFHSWKDTTTLFCRLHEGSDDQGPIIGAGVLHLSCLQFVRQLSSFRTLNTVSFSERAKALGGFGTFFARELLDTYFGHS